MNGRVFVKRWLATMLLLFGLVVWMAAVVDGRDGGLPFFVVCAALAAPLFRRTAKDAEWKRRYDARELTGQVVVDTLAEGEREPKQPDPQKRLKRFLVGAAVLDAVTMPFQVVFDLAKKQK